MISISTKCLLSDPDNFVCICYIPVLFEFNEILFTPRYQVSVYRTIGPVVIPGSYRSVGTVACLLCLQAALRSTIGLQQKK